MGGPSPTPAALCDVAKGTCMYLLSNLVVGEEHARLFSLKRESAPPAPLPR
jgi:hypothetical protein